MHGDSSRQKCGKQNKETIPTSLGLMNHEKGKQKFKQICVLFDSSCTSSIILAEFVNKLRPCQASKMTRWNTKGGTFVTSDKCKAQFPFPDFDNQKGIEWNLHVNSTSKASQSKHDMIIGGDIMDKIGIDVLHTLRVVQWGETTIPLKPKNVFSDEDINQMWFK